jgi:hypothetical protein
MRSIWMLAVVAGLAGGPAFAQGLIAPSRQYSTPKPEGLEKNYGLPTFGTPAEAMPKQQATTSKPKEEERPDAFRPMPSFARPDTQPSEDTPDFFQKPAGLASSQTTGVPNFFQDAPDSGLPKAAPAREGETPTFTTGTEGGESSSTIARPTDAPDD